MAHHCEGTISLVCPRIKTTTRITALGPQNTPQLQQAIQNSVSAIEAAGGLVLAHGLTDTGAGWLLTLTTGEYVLPDGA